MLAHKLSADEVRLVSEKARDLGIRPFTMWMWIKRLDVHALAIVVGADLSHRELLTHLSEGTVPDLDELQVFAALNGLPVSRPNVSKRYVQTAHVSARAGLDPREVSARQAGHSPKMPPIFEPGASSYGFENPDYTSLAA